MAYTAVNDKLKGRLRDRVTKDYLDFFYIPPEITDSVTPEYSPITVIGRSAPIHAYSGTGARSLSLELNFFAEENAESEVFKKVQWIQSLKYPEYIGKLMKPPHEVSLIIGRFIFLEGILLSAEVTWKAPYDENKFPMMATLSVTIEESVDTPYDYRAVRNSKKIGFGKEESGVPQGGTGKTASSVLRNRTTTPTILGGSSVAIGPGDV